MSLVPELCDEQSEALANLERNGFVIFPNRIPDETLHTMQAELQSSLESLSFQTPCLAQSRIEPDKHAELIANHMFGTHEHLDKLGVLFSRKEAINYQQVIDDFQPSTLTMHMLNVSSTYRNIWLDPWLLQIISTYMGMVPQLAEAYVRRNFPADYRTMNHYWHRDLNQPFHLLKMFIFLSDCTELTGPHEYIKGSHNNLNTLNNERYYSDEMVDEAFPVNGADRIKSIVKAGTIVIENTHGLHRANIPMKGIRDLGFAVFMPIRPMYTYKNYQFPKSALERMNQLQQAVIPKSCIT